MLHLLLAFLLAMASAGAPAGRGPVRLDVCLCHPDDAGFIQCEDKTIPEAAWLNGHKGRHPYDCDHPCPCATQSACEGNAIPSLQCTIPSQVTESEEVVVDCSATTDVDVPPQVLRVTYTFDGDQFIFEQSPPMLSMDYVFPGPGIYLIEVEVCDIAEGEVCSCQRTSTEVTVLPTNTGFCFTDGNCAAFPFCGGYLQSTYSGPAGTEGVGLCRPLLRECEVQTDGTRQVVVVQPEVLPTSEQVCATEGCELCDGLDQDCDGEVDEDLTGPGAPEWCLDEDGDGFGADATLIRVCQAHLPEGNYVGMCGDCNDSNAEVYPGAPEQCNDIDNDCDGVSTTVSTYCVDADGDGFIDCDNCVQSCSSPGPTYVLAGTNDLCDCLDTDPLVYPTQTEVCNGFDDNCDGQVDVGATCPVGEGCSAGQCVAICVPTTCAAEGATCGSVPDGCGGSLVCGSCATGEVCQSGVCQGQGFACPAGLSEVVAEYTTFGANAHAMPQDAVNAELWKAVGGGGIGCTNSANQFFGVDVGGAGGAGRSIYRLHLGDVQGQLFSVFVPKGAAYLGGEVCIVSEDFVLYNSTGAMEEIIRAFGGANGESNIFLGGNIDGFTGSESGPGGAGALGRLGATSTSQAQVGIMGPSPFYEGGGGGRGGAAIQCSSCPDGVFTLDPSSGGEGPLLPDGTQFQSEPAVELTPSGGSSAYGQGNTGSCAEISDLFNTACGGWGYGWGGVVTADAPSFISGFTRTKSSAGPGMAMLRYCSACGNGVLDAGEECDDGNGNNGDSCSSTCEVPQCADGIQNGDEEGIDCGGSCPVTCGTCSDGIQNGGEEGIDCGGPCGLACLVLVSNATYPGFLRPLSGPGGPAVIGGAAGDYVSGVAGAQSTPPELDSITCTSATYFISCEMTKTGVGSLFLRVAVSGVLGNTKGNYYYFYSFGGVTIERLTFTIPVIDWTVEDMAGQSVTGRTEPVLFDTCTDGVQDVGEDGVDCGGVCPNACI